MSDFLFFFFFNDTATTEIYTLSLHDALPISLPVRAADGTAGLRDSDHPRGLARPRAGAGAAPPRLHGAAPGERRQPPYGLPAGVYAPGGGASGPDVAACAAGRYPYRNDRRRRRGAARFPGRDHGRAGARDRRLPGCEPRPETTTATLLTRAAGPERFLHGGLSTHRTRVLTHLCNKYLAPRYRAGGTAPWHLQRLRRRSSSCSRLPTVWRFGPWRRRKR